MFKLKYENTIDFIEQNQQLMTCVYTCVGLIWVGYVFVFAVDYNKGLIEDFGLGLRVYFLFPFFISAFVLTAISLATHVLAKKGKQAQAAYINLTSISILCFVIIHYCNDTNAIFFVFALPITVSLLYIDSRPLLYTFSLNLVFFVCYSIVYLNRLPADDEAYKDFTEIFITSVMILIIYIAARIILNSLDAIMADVINKDEKIRRDSFTGLFNHSAFYDHLDKLIIDNHRKPKVFSLIVWDIDNFKSINDTFGHETGDKVLMLFIKALNEYIGEDDLAFRYGGEEFTVITPSGAKEAFNLSAKIRQRFTQYSVTLPLGKILTASAGVCEYNRIFGGSREFFSAADRALYVAKSESGKNASRLWTGDMVSTEKEKEMISS